MSNTGTRDDHPFEPGGSPFHTKGTIWMGIRDFVEAKVEGGVEAVARGMEPPLREFFTQLFVASGLYDLLPVTHVARAIAGVMRVDVLEYVRQSGVYQVERDMAGVYKPLLTSDSPAVICRRFASIHAQVYDFGRAEIVKEEPKRIEALATGIPEAIAWWWMRASESYLQPVLRAAGGRNPRLLWMPLQPDGERSGTALVRIGSHTVWT